MNLQTMLRGFEGLSVPVVGKLLGPPREIKAHLLPAGGAYFGPLDDPFPEFVFFDIERNGYESNQSGEAIAPLPEKLLKTGIHLILLYDPRVYLAAAERGMISERALPQYGVDRIVASYSVSQIATSILSVKVDIAEFLERSLGSPYQTEFRQRHDVLELTIGDGVPGMNGGQAKYHMPIRG